VLQNKASNDRVVCFEFCRNMMSHVAEDETFLTKICFSDEAEFNLSGKIIRHNVCIRESENPHTVFEHLRDSLKINVFCALSCDKMYRFFFFGGKKEKQFNKIIYLDMLE
jgi:hypothetical protein